jgi:DNA-binding transcriptional LysR family regulator
MPGGLGLKRSHHMPHRSRQFLRHGTLPQLAVFEAIVRLGSFTRAAHEMHMAQPTVSGLIRKLTDAAGVPLFARSGRHLVPTAAGRLLYKLACEVLDTLERAGTELAATRALHAERPQAPSATVPVTVLAP